MRICCEILGWKELDARKLESLIEEYNLDVDEVIAYVESFGGDNDINNYIYASLMLGCEKIKEELIEWLKDNEDVIDALERFGISEIFNKIKEFECNPYTNYMDSFFDSCFNEFNYENPTSDDYYNLIEGIFGYTREEIEEEIREIEEEEF